jgi:long-chain acyl-CoA synthetase
MNLATWLERAGRDHPGRPAISLGGRIVSDYERFGRRAAGLAASLRGRFALGQGDRVAIVATNCGEYLEAMFGVWHAGLVAVPVNAKLHPAEIGCVLQNSGTRLVFASADLAGAVGTAAGRSQTEIVTLGSPAYERLATADPMPVVPRTADDIAWLFYTSGTTGRPKGAMLTHGNLAAASRGYLSDVDPTLPEHALLHAAPLSHGSGLYAIPTVCQAALHTIPESGGFDADEVLRLFQHHPGTSMFAAPTMIRRLVECTRSIDPDAIRTIVWGGAPMHVADILRALDRFGPCFAQIYGQGETPMTISVLTKRDVADRNHPRWLERLGSAGVANSVIELRIGGDDGRTVAAGGVGEILVRGPTVMAGYWENPEATQAALRDGWLHTGDVGALDAEGYLTLKDRSKDVIISGGSNIYPREVEEVLLAHPLVREASVIGRPDPEWGEIVVAYVVGEATAAELDSACLDRIARFKRPKDYVMVPELPKNNYGKILKTELRALDRQRPISPKSDRT